MWLRPLVLAIQKQRYARRAKVNARVKARAVRNSVKRTVRNVPRKPVANARDVKNSAKRAKAVKMAPRQVARMKKALHVRVARAVVA